MAFAEEQGMPQDIMRMPATVPNDSDSGSGDASTELTEHTDQVNFHKMVMEKTNDRNAMESRAHAGQRKQAEEVNRIEEEVKKSWKNGQYAPSKCQRTGMPLPPIIYRH
jgi:hypothetical protein